MSIRKALKIRKSFTVEQQLFAKEQKLDGEHTAAEWIDFLEEIAEFDSYVDAARKKTSIIMTVLIILTILSLIGTFASGGILLPVFLLLFIAMIIYISIYVGLKKVDIPNRFRLFVFPLVRMLQDEMKEESKIYIKADFKVGMTKDYLVRKVEGIYNKNLRKKVDSEFFSYPVLELKTKFADGNVLSLYINDSSRKNSIRKTNYRGKTKWKTKYKIKTNIEVNLSAKENAYTLARPNNAPQANTKVVGVSQAKKDDKNIITYRHLKVSTTDEYIPEIDIVLSAIATAYQQLKPVAA